jgi:hypothetical protein
LPSLGNAALERGEHERALTLHEESLALYDKSKTKRAWQWRWSTWET